MNPLSEKILTKVAGNNPSTLPVLRCVAVSHGIAYATGGLNLRASTPCDMPDGVYSILRGKLGKLTDYELEDFPLPSEPLEFGESYPLSIPGLKWAAKAATDDLARLALGCVAVMPDPRPWRSGTAIVATDGCRVHVQSIPGEAPEMFVPTDILRVLPNTGEIRVARHETDYKLQLGDCAIRYAWDLPYPNVSQVFPNKAGDFDQTLRVNTTEPLRDTIARAKQDDKSAVVNVGYCEDSQPADSDRAAMFMLTREGENAAGVSVQFLLDAGWDGETAWACDALTKPVYFPLTTAKPKKVKKPTLLRKLQDLLGMPGAKGDDIVAAVEQLRVRSLI